MVAWTLMGEDRGATGCQRLFSLGSQFSLLRGQPCLYRQPRPSPCPCPGRKD